MSLSSCSNQSKRSIFGVARSSLLTALLSLPLACSSTSGESSGTGGSTASGGHMNGGAPGSGGASAKGGAPASGGSVSSGGTQSSGGASTGGVIGSGGAAAGSSSAGASAKGGAGGVSAGGAPGSGGGGGSAGGSNGGASAAGAAGAPVGGASTGSTGCGSASPLKSGDFTESIGGATRKYVLDVPSGYDTNKKYKLIFVWHPLAGSASQVVSGGYNGLKSLSNGSAIFVAADGLYGSNSEASGVGWWNVDNVDMKFLSAMLERLQSNLCIDKERIFSTGFSFGGMMSYTVGFEFDVFRAVAPCSGDLQVIPHKDTYTRPLPIMAFHGNNDGTVAVTRGRAARDKYLTRNGCGTQTQPAEPSPCVQYQGCSAPTYWCEFSGGHEPWSGEPQAIWKFFSQF